MNEIWRSLVKVSSVWKDCWMNSLCERSWTFFREKETCNESCLTYEVIWKEKKKRKKKKWEKKWDYIDEKNEWLRSERKMSGWDASPEVDERFLRRKNTWLTAEGAGSYDFDTSMMKDFDDEFNHLIDDRIRPDNQWYKAMIWLFWWCSWCYHLLRYTQAYEKYLIY